MKRRETGRVAFRWNPELVADLESFLSSPNDNLSHLVRQIAEEWVKKEKRKKPKQSV